MIKNRKTYSQKFQTWITTRIYAPTYTTYTRSNHGLAQTTETTEVYWTVLEKRWGFNCDLSEEYALEWQVGKEGEIVPSYTTLIGEQSFKMKDSGTSSNTLEMVVPRRSFFSIGHCPCFVSVDRCARKSLHHNTRHFPELRHRPGLVRTHCAVRHRRQGRDQPHPGAAEAHAHQEGHHPFPLRL